MNRLIEVATLAQPGNLQLQCSNSRIPLPAAIAIAGVDPVRVALTEASAAEGVGLSRPEDLYEVAHHLAQQVAIGLPHLFAQPRHKVMPGFAFTEAGRTLTGAVTAVL